MSCIRTRGVHGVVFGVFEYHTTSFRYLNTIPHTVPIRSIFCDFDTSMVFAIMVRYTEFGLSILGQIGPAQILFWAFFLPFWAAGNLAILVGPFFVPF